MEQAIFGLLCCASTARSRWYEGSRVQAPSRGMRPLTGSYSFLSRGFPGAGQQGANEIDPSGIAGAMILSISPYFLSASIGVNRWLKLFSNKAHDCRSAADTTEGHITIKRSYQRYLFGCGQRLRTLELFADALSETWNRRVPAAGEVR